MIVLLNTSNKTVTICDKIVKVYHWSKLKEISLALEGKDVFYVSEVLATTGEEVIELISNSYDDENVGDQTYLENKEYYIHSKTKNRVIVSYNGKDYLFKGLYDFRPISSLPDGMMENSKMIIESLKLGLIEVIDDSEKAFLEMQYEKECISQKESLEKLEESVKGSVDDPIEIDIGFSGNFKKGKK